MKQKLGRIDELREKNINKQKTQNQSEVNNTTTETKNTLEGVNSR